MRGWCQVIDLLTTCSLSNSSLSSVRCYGVSFYANRIHSAGCIIKMIFKEGDILKPIRHNSILCTNHPYSPSVCISGINTMCGNNLFSFYRTHNGPRYKLVYLQCTKCKSMKSVIEEELPLIFKRAVAIQI